VCSDGLDDTHVNQLRQEMGQKAALDGEPLHESASEDWAKGYRRAALGFGSNIMPKNFGRTGEKPSDWLCLCGNLNKGTVKRKVAGVGVVCWECGISRQLAEDAQAEGD
jgi:hypothetical protein